MLTCDREGAFPHDTLTRRVPDAILARTLAAARPRIGEDATRRVQALQFSCQHALEAPVPALLEDDAAWRACLAPYAGCPSFAALPWFVSECLVYRLLLQATGFHRQGAPGCGVDVFAEEKAAGLAKALPALEASASAAADHGLEQLLLDCLWGNRADGSLWSLTGGAGDGAGEGLLVWDGARAAELLQARPGRAVHIVCDNAGREVAADLALADHLVRGGRRVVLWVKPTPFFVSDATPADVDATVAAMCASGCAALAARGARLAAAVESGAVAVRAHEFFTLPLPMRDAPDAVAGRMEGAALVVVKGDLMYRKLVNDEDLPATTPAADVFGGALPAPILAVRTCKSPAVVGLSEATLAGLPAGGEWRVDGSRGMVQLVGP